VEAVSAYLLQMTNPLCSPKLLRASVGPVSEFDIEHADAAGGHIIAFNLPHDPDNSGRAERKGIKLLEQNVIYRIVDDVRAVLEEKLPPQKIQKVTGEAEVAMSFEIGVGGRKKMKIAGLKVRNGVVARGSRVRVTRGEERVYDGELFFLPLFRCYFFREGHFADLMQQVSSPVSRTSRRMFKKCAEVPSVEWASRTGRTLKSVI